jgi:hypothetical protein
MARLCRQCSNLFHLIGFILLAMILTMAHLINSAQDSVMNSSNPTPVAGTAAKIGGWLFALWSVLHIWVGATGVVQCLTGGNKGLSNMLIGLVATLSRQRSSHVH